MPFRRRLRTFALVACIAAAAPPRISRADETSPANVAAARKHFERARAFYSEGSYREAVSELEAAHSLDPNAKDLVFNLGVVHEKLADIEEALKWFGLYRTMDLNAQERDRADAYVRRLEGAKKELEEKQAAQAQGVTEPTIPGAGSNPGAAEQRTRLGARGPAVATNAAPAPSPTILGGRVDAWTLGAASASAAGLLFGVVMGIKALDDRPSAYSVTTSTSYPYATYRGRVDQAHREAIWADVGFGAGLVAGVATAYLYFGRPRPTSSPATGSTTVSVGPISGGSALIVKGRF